MTAFISFWRDKRKYLAFFNKIDAKSKMPLAILTVLKLSKTVNHLATSGGFYTTKYQILLK
ncbi:MAG: hypothetical protein H6996_05540 [Moraxellaceae bacterium]|nr:hypothetical protein [Moraxellaceae bacterium]MCP5177165.1 hypothetical protein [Moraxellaceae bacterium]